MKRQYKDWSAWWTGLRVNLVKCLGTTGISLLGTNGVDKLEIPGLAGIGMSWKTACGQFAIHLAWEVFSYLKANPDAPVIVEEVDTQTFNKGEGE